MGTACARAFPAERATCEASLALRFAVVAFGLFETDTTLACRMILALPPGRACGVADSCPSCTDSRLSLYLLLLAELEPLEGTEGVRILGDEFPHAEELLVIVPPADRL